MRHELLLAPLVILFTAGLTDSAHQVTPSLLTTILITAAAAATLSAAVLDLIKGNSAAPLALLAALGCILALAAHHSPFPPLAEAALLYLLARPDRTARTPVEWLALLKVLAFRLQLLAESRLPEDHSPETADSPQAFPTLIRDRLDSAATRIRLAAERLRLRTRHALERLAVREAIDARLYCHAQSAVSDPERRAAARQAEQFLMQTLEDHTHATRY